MLVSVESPPFSSHSSPKWLNLLVCFLVWLCVWPTMGWTRKYCVNYHAEPDPADLLAFEMSILQPEAKVDLAPGQALGRKYLAYLSVVEVNESASYLPELKKAGIALLGQNKQWRSVCVDITQPAWEEFFLTKLAKAAVDKGFDGFFLDTLDSTALLTKERPDKQDAYRQALIQLIRKLKEKYPDKEIIVNRGFEILSEIKGSVQGVLIESVFQTFDAIGKYGPVKVADHNNLVEKIRELRAAGWPVYVVDYLERGKDALAQSVAEQISKLGAEPFLTTKELSGVLMGKTSRLPRRILVIYGSVLAESEVEEKFAADTFTAERLQMPLEWMGYEVEYLNIGKVSPPTVLDENFCGVIFDVETQLPYGGEIWYVDWILAQKERGLKILFTGQYPFQQDVQRVRLLKGLGLWGTFAQVPKPLRVELQKVNRDLMNYEALSTAHPTEVEDSRAPKGAQVDLSVGCTDAAANKLVFDAIYQCSWGGALLEPYATFQASADHQASLFDPFKYLNRIFPGGQFPAPDPTTRDGERIFYSHIDGDGFCGVTGYAGDQICGEIVRDRILKKYPLPITVSLVEASTRGLEKHQNAKDVPHYEAVARSCFALHNVQAASHSFSHPYVWIDHDDEFIPLYETRGLELKQEVGYDVEKPNMDREIRGSIEYIKTLLPPGKKIDLMLWSGNCRPSPEALRVCRKMGIENMNGGHTVISKRRPFMSNVSPRIMQWDGELQIHAANQNEFVYTKNWSGPFYGGFTQVIETFEQTEEPRRLKPVNIYYHFYGAMTIGSLRALEKVHQWALDRPLHSMTAADYARTVRDSYHTRIYQQGPRQWLMVNQGHQRTFRLDATTGVPDIAGSQGITGYRRIKDSLYIHTEGQRVTRLLLADKPKEHLFLESSQGEISWQTRRGDRLEFSVKELRPNHETVLGGSAPGQRWKLVVNGASTEIIADPQGRLILKLRGDSTVSVSSFSA